MIGDLAKRLVELRYEAEAMFTIVQPNGRHTVIEHQTRTACCVMLNTLQRRIQDAEGLALIIAHKEVAV